MMRWTLTLDQYVEETGKIDDFFDSSSESLIIFHVNCNHLLSHIDKMSIRFEGLVSGVDVIGVNETFLTPSVSSKVVDIVGYRFLRNDRSVYGRPGWWCWLVFEEPFEEQVGCKIISGGYGVYFRGNWTSSQDFVGRIYVQAPEY
jgi:hypothetical protein